MHRKFNTSMLTGTAIMVAAGALLMPQIARADVCYLLNSDGTGTTSSVSTGGQALTDIFTQTTAPNDPTDLACGTNANAGTNIAPVTQATAVGANTVAGQNGTAIGFGAQASATNSVALGAGSVANAANTVSIGTTGGGERRIVNVAPGTVGTDAVNYDQLALVSSHADTAGANANAALSNAAAAQTAASTALTTATTAQTTANTALSNSATALTTATTALTTATTTQASVTSLQTTVGTQATTISAIQTLNAQQNTSISALQAAQSSLGQQVVTTNRNASGGIAAAMAMGGTIMPADAKFALSFNLATYRGEQGFSGTAAIRVSDHVYLNGGFAGSTVKGSSGARAGMTFAW